MKVFTKVPKQDKSLFLELLIVYDKAAIPQKYMSAVANAQK